MFRCREYCHGDPGQVDSPGTMPGTVAAAAQAQARPGRAASAATLAAGRSRRRLIGRLPRGAPAGLGPRPRPVRPQAQACKHTPA
jgi:hypothetical protein